jgi:hypothetical protein
MMLAVWVCCAGAAARASGEPQPASEPVPTGHSAAAFYNAGNAEARAGHPALAVLDYERARLLAPTDPDIAANLRHVREAAGLPPQTGGWLAAHARLANPDTLYWLGLCGLLCAGVSLVILRAQRHGAPDQARRARPLYRRSLQIAAIFGSLFTVLGVGDALATNLVMHEYVVRCRTGRRCSWSPKPTSFRPTKSIRVSCSSRTHRGGKAGLPAGISSRWSRSPRRPSTVIDWPGLKHEV